MKEFGSRHTRSFGSNNRLSFSGAHQEMERREKKEQQRIELEERNRQKAIQSAKRGQERDRARVNREYQRELKAGEEYNRRKREAELEAIVEDRFNALWKDNEAKYKSDSGKAIVTVKNSLQMDIRNISMSLERLAKKYSKKTGNQHINEGVRKLKETIEPILEQAIVELLRYTIEEERKQNQELLPKVAMAIAKAEYDIGHDLSSDQVRRVSQEVVTGVIQGRISRNNIDNYVYKVVDTYSRIVT